MPTFCSSEFAFPSKKPNIVTSLKIGKTQFKNAAHCYYQSSFTNMSSLQVTVEN
jgi:hypothetical protein